MATTAVLNHPIIVRRPGANGSSAVYPVQWFIILQNVCQIVLLTSLAASSFRPVIRIAAFSMSLLFLVFLRGKGTPHPASKPALIVFALIAVSLLHPDTNNLASGLAEIALYVAILAPLFWIPRRDLDLKSFRVILLTLWAFYALSATFGILQVYFPGRFQPRISTILAAKGPGYIKAMTITVAGGQRVLRPMGLTDTPGGAGTAAFYTVLIGMGFMLTERALWRRSFFMGSMFMGMLCLYLCQVRALLIMLAFCVLAILILLAWRGATAKLTMLLTISGSIVILAFSWAVAVGGSSVSKRIATLGSTNASRTYYTSRGRFLEYTIKELLPKYPVGAGLGRWGMMNTYFGNHDQPALWAEIQWTAWLYDGGVPLILAYLVTLGFGFRTALKIALERNKGDLWLWGLIVVAYNLGALALVFSYPFFVSQTGMEFWMLNALLFTVARSTRPAALAAQPWNANRRGAKLPQSGFNPNRDSRRFLPAPPLR